MSWGLLIAGLILATASIRGNQRELFTLLKDDFAGDNPFIYWAMSIIVLILIGNWKAAKPLTDAFVGLVILVIVVNTYNDGEDLFGSFMRQVREGMSGENKLST